ncbi:hypothetical protein BDW60DRAFT_154029 [Aspergillus nidulans var. acristatus]
MLHFCPPRLIRWALPILCVRSFPYMVCLCMRVLTTSPSFIFESPLSSSVCLLQSTMLSRLQAIRTHVLLPALRSTFYVMRSYKTSVFIAYRRIRVAHTYTGGSLSSTYTSKLDSSRRCLLS